MKTGHRGNLLYRYGKFGNLLAELKAVTRQKSD
jgi:hypothetical protein